MIQDIRCLKYKTLVLISDYKQSKTQLLSQLTDGECQLDSSYGCSFISSSLYGVYFHLWNCDFVIAQHIRNIDTFLLYYDAEETEVPLCFKLNYYRWLKRMANHVFVLIDISNISQDIGEVAVKNVQMWGADVPIYFIRSASRENVLSNFDAIINI